MSQERSRTSWECPRTSQEQAKVSQKHYRTYLKKELGAAKSKPGLLANKSVQLGASKRQCALLLWMAGFWIQQVRKPSSNKVIWEW